MSQETSKWLDENILVGMTAVRGEAWHRLAGSDNSFDGPVPIERVRTLLARYAAEDVPVKYADTDKIIPGVKAIRRIDNHAHYKIFSEGYQQHDYNEWLTRKVADILDQVPGDLVIANAGGLQGGAVAFVQMEMPDTFKAAMGVEFRPNLTAMTSLNGKFSTKYKLMIKNVVCDNTLTMGLSEDSLFAAFKHTSKSLHNITKVRADLALGFITEAADAFAAEVEALGNVTVTDEQWSKFLAVHVKLTDDNGEPVKGRTLTLREHEIESLNQLWNYSEMVAPWKNTEYGVIQTVNTHDQYNSVVRGERQERNFVNALGNKMSTLDAETREQIHAIVA